MYFLFGNVIGFRESIRFTPAFLSWDSYFDILVMNSYHFMVTATFTLALVMFL